METQLTVNEPIAGSTPAATAKLFSHFIIRTSMDDSDDHNKLCDMLTQLVVSAMPADDKHNSEKLHKLCQFVFRDTNLSATVAALLLLAKQ